MANTSHATPSPFHLSKIQLGQDEQHDSETNFAISGHKIFKPYKFFHRALVNAEMYTFKNDANLVIDEFLNLFKYIFNSELTKDNLEYIKEKIDNEKNYNDYFFFRTSTRGETITMMEYKINGIWKSVALYKDVNPFFKISDRGRYVKYKFQDLLKHIEHINNNNCWIVNALANIRSDINYIIEQEGGKIKRRKNNKKSNRRKSRRKNRRKSRRKTRR